MGKRALVGSILIVLAGALLVTAGEEALLKPESLNETAPESFRVKVTTTKGDFVIEVHREWAPIGADRFYNLVKNGYYDDIAFFRVLDGFMAQFGIHGDPAVAAIWSEANIKDDPVKQSNTRGFVTYAKKNIPDSRSTQLFINFGDNSSNLDPIGFAPFGQVVEGMEVVDELYSGYGEGAPRGRGPNQMKIISDGNEYLQENFPNLDYIKKAVIVE